MKRHGHTLAPATILILATAVAFWAVPQALAQDQNPRNAYSFNPGPQQTPAQLLSDHLVNLATESLIGSGKVRDDQYQRASILLNMALKIVPKDAELWRLDAELASRMNDDQRRLQALGHYVDLQPKDDAAQLTLILSQLNKLQTLDARLNRVEGILNSPVADQFSKPLRSRLASYAASAAKQLGDNKKFAHWLTVAASLDPANEQAALMVYKLAASHHATALQRGAALIRLVQAAPMDGSVRIELAQVLARQGVYDRAARQFRLGREMSGQALPPRIYRLWALSLAAMGQSDTAIELLRQVEKANTPATQPAKGGKKSSATAPAATQPSAGGLPLKLELLRLGIAYARKDADLTKKTFDTIRKRLGQVKAADKADAAENLAWISAVFNMDTGIAKHYLMKHGRTGDPTIQLIRGWLALHAKQAAAASKALKPIVSKDPLAQLGVALLSGVDASGQAQALEAVVHRSPGSLAAMLAAAALRAENRPVYPTSVGGSLDQAMSQVSSEVWHVADPTTWVDMRIKVSPQRVTYLRPMHATIIIRNATQIPLAVGPQSTIHAKLMLQIAPFIMGNSLGTLPAKVVDGDRRLTLGAGDTMRLHVNLMRSTLGMLILRKPFTTIMYNVSAELDPRTLRNGGITHGPLGSSDTARTLQSWALPPTASNIEKWLDDLKGDVAVQRITAIARLVQITHKNSPAADAKMLGRISAAINRTYPTLRAVGKAWTVLCLEDQSSDRSRFKRVFELAERSSQPLVRVTYLATKVDKLSSPAIGAALRSNDSQIHRFAAALRKGLKADAAAKAKAKAKSTGKSPTSNP